MNHDSYQIPTDRAFSLNLPDGDVLTRHDARSTVIVLAPPKLKPTRPRPTGPNIAFARRVADSLGLKLKIEALPSWQLPQDESGVTP